MAAARWARKGTRGAHAGLLLLMLAALPSRAVDFFDGKIEAHGFGEMQVRGISRNFSEQLDLAQWYNIINVEIEVNPAPDGFGPFDLFEAYVRVEGRYDAIYSNGFGLFPSVNTYGDDAKRLPGRLSDARENDYSGVIPPPSGQSFPRHPFPEPAGFVPFRDADGEIIPESGFPGFDTLFRQNGPDAIAFSGDEPAAYTFGPVLDYRFGLLHIRDQPGGGTQVVGPWLPKNRVTALGALADRANPFRGRFTPAGGTRYHELDVEVNTDVVSGNGLGQLRDSEWVLRERTGTLAFDPLADDLLDVVNSDAFTGAGLPVSEFLVRRTNTEERLNPLLEGGVLVDPAKRSELLFGGDWNPSVPCFEPSTDPTSDAQAQIRGDNSAEACIPNGRPNPDDPDGPGLGTNQAILGGTGELPFRPGPDESNLAVFDPRRAQGLYIPSMGLRRELSKGEFDDLGVNFSETERSFNRGQSQQAYGELKEAYLELELFDSRLWSRLGLQNIVWGKTELFRTTDQFNPVDFALSSLPNLEESRIALWSGRFIYSFYDVWAFEDVRAEFAFNFDRFQPTDLGACGEPYTIDIACSLPFGASAHGLLGVGIAGVDRPPDAWDDISEGVELGGRVEWRWSKFSFALTDFYGYGDFPFFEPFFDYERNVDPASGRPRIAESSGPCGDAGADLRIMLNASLSTDGVGRDGDCLKPGGRAGSPNANRFDDDAILKPDPEDPDTWVIGKYLTSPQNALEFHHANQQIFAVLCSSTVGLAASLDPGACAFNIFASNAPLLDPTATNGNILPLSEALTGVLAGETSEGMGNFIQVLQNSATGDAFGGGDGDVFAELYPLDPNDPNEDPSTKSLSFSFLGNVPIRPLNRDRSLVDAQGVEDKNSPLRASQTSGDGFATYTFAGFLDTRIDENDAAEEPDDFLSLDSTLSRQQRALLGCGPVWGTRCDSSAFQPNPFQAGETLFEVGGGIDLLNAEASALLQAWPGFEGTATPGLNGYREGQLWSTIDPALVQPGTIGFDGGPVCTRYLDGRTVVLPGCRGVATPDDLEASGLDRVSDPVEITGSEVVVTFQNGYHPRVDGCIFAPNIDGMTVRGRYVDGGVVDLSQCAISTTRLGDQINDVDNLVRQREVPTGVIDPNSVGAGAATLYHPIAGCLNEGGSIDLERFENCYTYQATRTVSDINPTGNPPVSSVVQDSVNPFTELRDFDSEFLSGGAAQVFRSEMAAMSWNFLMVLVMTSCDKERDDKNVEADCYDGRVVDGKNRAYRSDACSFAAPHLCRNVKGFLNIAGTTSQQVRAGGNGRFGRRTFAWHGGQEGVIRYQRRNVLGFSADFAEDVTKSSWGLESTWINNVPFADAGSETGLTFQDTLNFTLSVDRPTFINFMNPNRTFFFNTQWFFQYQTNYRDTFFNNGPFNVLFTFACFTGYYQDRLLPNFVTVYDFKSQSGAILPSVAYRFTESFQVEVGFLFFFGRTQLSQMRVNPIAPPANRAALNPSDPTSAYVTPVDNLLSAVRNRDEVYMKLRWTF